MKRKNRIKVLTYIAIFMATFIIGENAYAGSVLNCHYDANVKQLAGSAKNVSFDIIVNDDDTIVMPNASKLQEDAGGLYYFNLDYLEGTLNKNYVSNMKVGTKYTCPSISLAFDGNSTFTAMVGTFTEDVSSITPEVSATSLIKNKEESEKKIAKREDTCIREKPLRNDDIGVNISFYTLDGEKMWSVTGHYRVSGTASGKAGSTLTLGDKTFAIESNDVISKVFSKDECGSVPLFIRTPAGATTNTITLTKPDSTENGSYKATKAFLDDGSDIKKNPASKSSTWAANDGNTNKFLKKMWNMIKIIVPLLVIIFSIVDFLKVLFTSDEKNYKEAYHKMLWRIAVGIILFVLPALLTLALDLAGLKDIGIFEIFS